MRANKLSLLIILLSTVSMWAQEKDAICMQIENRIYADNLDVTLYELHTENTLFPDQWISTFNDHLFRSIKNSEVFKTIYTFDAMKDDKSQHYDKPVHYYANFEFFDITIDGKTLKHGDRLPYESAHYIISGNFALQDVVKGVNTISQTIIFKGTAESLSDKDFISKMGYYFQKQITDAIHDAFPTTLRFMEMGKVSKDKVKSLYVNEEDWQRAGKPKYLGIYILKNSYEVKGGEPINVFDKVAHLTCKYDTEDDKMLYEVVDGKSRILPHVSSGTPIYITSIALGKK